MNVFHKILIKPEVKKEEKKEPEVKKEEKKEPEVKPVLSEVVEKMLEERRKEPIKKDEDSEEAKEEQTKFNPDRRIEGENHIIDGKLEYHMEKKLMEKLRRIATRITDKTDQNAFIINHGLTGSGKTTSSLVEAHIVSILTGREIHLYFTLDKLIDFQKTTNNKIVIWDEPAFHSLSTDSTTVLSKNLFRLINTGRLKRHFTIINFTKFWRFNSDILTDTALFMINMNNNISQIGRFLYLPQENLEKLWRDYQRDGKKNYAKYKTFGGKMPLIPKELFKQLDITIEGKKHCTYQDYLDLRDKAVQNIGIVDKKKDKTWGKLNKLRLAIGKMYKDNIIAKHDLKNYTGASYKSMSEWSHIEEDGETKDD